MSNRLYLGNLSYQTTEESLVSGLASHGFQVSNVKIIRDRESGNSRGFGFAEVVSVADAQNAVSQLNGALIDGRPLKVDHATERAKSSGGGGGGGGGGGYRGGGGGGGGYGGGGGGGGGDEGGRGGRGRKGRDRDSGDRW